jgi:hypothetical protein
MRPTQYIFINVFRSERVIRDTNDPTCLQHWNRMLLFLSTLVFIRVAKFYDQPISHGNIRSRVDTQ